MNRVTATLLLLLCCPLLGAQNLAKASPQVMPIGSVGPWGPSQITLGNTTAGSTVNTGYQAARLLPVVTYGGGGYTLNSVSVNVSSPNPMNVGLYSGTSNANCDAASGNSICGATLLCSVSAVTPVAGSNTYTASQFSGTNGGPGGCGTLAANTYYFLAVHATGSGVTLDASQNTFCPGTGLFGLYSSVASDTLPATMGSQSELSASQCMQATIALNCVGACSTAPTPWVLISYAGNTSGAAVTTSNLDTGSYGYNGTFGGTLTASTTYSNAHVKALTNPVVINGSSYSGGTMSILRAVASTDYITYDYAHSVGGSPQSVTGVWMYNTGNTESTGAQFDLWEQDGGNSNTVGAYGTCANSGAPPCFKVERTLGTGGTTFWGEIPFAQSTWYFVVEYSTSSGPYHQLAVYDTTGTPLANYANQCAGAASTICIPNTGSGDVVRIKLLNEGSGPGVPAGNWYYGSILHDPTGTTFNSIAGTYGEIFFPDSPQVIGPTLARMVHDGLIPHAAIKDGHWYSYALGRSLN